MKHHLDIVNEMGKLTGLQAVFTDIAKAIESQIPLFSKPVYDEIQYCIKEVQDQIQKDMDFKLADLNESVKILNKEVNENVESSQNTEEIK